MVKEKPKRKGPIDVLPSNAEEWAVYDCPDELRDAFKQDTSSQVINRSTIVKPVSLIKNCDQQETELIIHRGWQSDSQNK